MQQVLLFLIVAGIATKALGDLILPAAPSENESNRITFELIDSPQFAGSNFNVVVTVRDAAGLRVTQVNSSVQIRAEALAGSVTVTPSTLGPFIEGEWRGALQIDNAARLVRLRGVSLPGESNPFQVESQPFRVLTLATVDIGSHPQSGAIYATIPASGGEYADKLVALDPGSLTVTNSFFLGSDPRQLEISPNGQFLYTTISNRTALRRFNLNSNSPGSQIDLGGSNGVVQIRDFAVSGTSADQVALITTDEWGSNSSVRMYNSGVPQSIPSFGDVLPSFVEAASASPIYYAFEASPPFRFVRFAFSAVFVTNGVLDQPVPFVVRGNAAYTASGRSINATTFAWLGDYPEASGLVEVDAVRKRTFYLRPEGNQSYSLRAYDRDSRTLVASLPLPSLAGEPGRLLRYGSNGLVFNAGHRQLWFIDSNSLLPTNVPADLRVRISLLPPLLTSNAPCLITVSNAGPGDATFVRVSNSLPASVSVVSTVVSNGSVHATDTAFTWEITHLAPGQSASVTLIVRPTGIGWGTNQAVVWAYEQDPDFTNNLAKQATFVQLPLQPNSSAAYNLAVESLVYDPAMDRLLLSVRAGASSNGIAVFDPNIGRSESWLELGSGPSKLARSDNGQFLYVSLPDLAVVRRLVLPALGANLQFPIGDAATYAANLEVLPGQPRSVAVSRVVRFGSGLENHLGVGIFDDDIQRTNTSAGCQCGYNLAFSGPERLLGSRGDGTLDQFLIDADGITLVKTAIFSSLGKELSAAEGSIYSSGGLIVNAESLASAGGLSGAELGTSVVVDGANGRVHFVAGSGSIRQLLTFDQLTGAAVGQLVLTNVSGTPENLIRWGEDGLAFRTTGGQLFTVRSRYVHRQAVADLAVLQVRSQEMAAPHEIVTFITTVTNGSAIRAVDIWLTNTFSDGSTLLEVSSTTGHCTIVSGYVVCDLGPLQGHEGVTIQVKAARASQGVLSSLAGVNSAQVEGEVRNNTAFAVVRVQSGAGEGTLQLLNLPIRDLAWDAARGRLLATCSTNIPDWRDSLLSLDPGSLVVDAVIPAGPGAHQVEVAAVGNRIYVDSYNSIRVFDAVSLAPISNFGLGLSGYYALAQAADLAAAPDGSDTVAVVRNSDVAIFANGVMRSNAVGLNYGDYRITFGRSGTDLYSQNDYLTGFSRMRVDETGVASVYSTQELTPLFTPPAELKFFDDLIYNSYGGVIDPALKIRVATLADIQPGTLLTIDEPGRRVYYLVPANGAWQLRAYELGTLRPAGTAFLPSFPGTPLSLTRCGGNRLAFLTSAGQLGIWRTSLIATNSPTDLGIALHFEPAPHFQKTDLSLYLTVTNRGPNEARLVNWSNTVPTGLTLVAAQASRGSVLTNSVGVSGTISNLAAGADVRVEIRVRANSSALFTCSAAVSSDAVDSNVANNSASATLWPQAGGLNALPSIFEVGVKDLAGDSRRSRLYLSIGNNGGPLANSILVLDPEAGTVLPPIAIGSDPGRLAASADGQFLYVGLDGGGTIQRLNLDTLQTDLSIPVPNSRRIIEMVVSPTNANMVAFFREFDGVISLLEDGILRPNELGGYVGLLAFSDRTGDLFTCNNYYSGVPLYRVDLGPTGLRVLDSQPAKPPQIINMKFADGLLYFNSGMVLDPVSRRVQAVLAVDSGSLVEPDPISGRSFHLNFNGSGATVRAIDQRHWIEVGQETFAGGIGAATRFLRWGSNGFAYSTTAGRLSVFRSGLVPTSSPADVALTVTAQSNVLSVGDLWVLNLVLSNSGPAIATSLVVTQLFSANVTSVVAHASVGSISKFVSPLTWTLRALNPNETASCSVTVTVAQAGPLFSRAGVRHAANDPVLANNVDWKTATLGTSSVERKLTLRANELLYDEARNRIYASVPNTEPGIGNCVLALDPQTGESLARWFIGSGPNQLALSDDGRFLHIGLDGEMGVARLNLVSEQVDLKFPISLTSLQTSLDLEGQPGHPESIAAALSGYATIPIIFDAGVARTNNGPGFAPSRFVEFSRAGDWLYGAIPFGLGSGLIRYQVNPDGLTLPETDYSVGGDDPFEQDNGLLFRQSGVVVDPVGPFALFSYPVTGLVAPDSRAGSVFYLAQNGAGQEVQAFQFGRNELIGKQSFPDVRGTPIDLIRAGDDRLAFQTTAGQVWLVHSPLVVPPLSPVDLMVTQSASQETVLEPRDQVRFSIVVSNRGPGAASSAIVTDIIPALTASFSALVSQGTWESSGSLLQWRPGLLAAGAVARLDLSLTITNTTLFTNIVQATPDVIDLNPADNASSFAFAGLWFQTPDSVRRIALATRDLVYDPIGERLFASLVDATAGRQIVWFDVESGAVAGSIPLDGVADRFALSGDNRYLYVSFVGTSLVQRVCLVSNNVDLSFQLPGADAPGAFLVVPGQPETLVAQVRTDDLVMAVFDRGAPRPESIPTTPFPLLAASRDGAFLYGYSNFGTGGASPDVFRYRISTNGLTYVDAGPSDTPWGGNVDLAFFSGRLYFGNGNILNPEGWVEEARFPQTGWFQTVEINEAASRVIFLSHDGAVTALLTIYDQATQRELETMRISRVEGGVNALTQCGSDCVAFRSSTDIYLVRNSQIPHLPPADVTVQGRVEDGTHTIGNPIQYSLVISNAGPNAAANATLRLPLSGGFLLGSVLPSQGTNLITTGTLECRLGTLAPFAQATISITVTNALVGILSNTFSVFSSAIDLVSTNNHLTLTTAQALPQLTIQDVSIREGHLGLSNVIFIVSHNAQSAPGLSVTFNAIAGTATAASDFIPITGLLTFGAGTNRLQISIPVRGDTLVESNEFFRVRLSNPVGATLAKADGIGTIEDDDGRPGEIHSLAWSPLAPRQFSTAPFPAMIVAQDSAHNICTTFQGSVVLSTLLTTGSVINGDFETGSLDGWIPLNAGNDPGPYSIIPFDINGSGQLSYVFRLTPNSGLSDGIRQVVELRGGITYNFDLDAAQILEDVSYNGGETVVRILAGSTEVCAFNFGDFGLIGPHDVFRKSLHGAFLAPTNGLYDLRIIIERSSFAYGPLWGVVDNLRVAPASPPIPIPQTITLTNGLWAGLLQLKTVAEQVRLQADDLNGHWGVSATLSILPPPSIRAVWLNGAIRLAFPTPDNWRYQVQASSNLVDWIPLSPFLQATGEEEAWFDAEPVLFPAPPQASTCRFYRILSMP